MCKYLQLNLFIRTLQICSLLAACRYHSGSDARCKLFSIQIGLFCVDNDPIIDERDTDFILDVLRNLFEKNQIIIESKISFSNNKYNRTNNNIINKITKEQENNAEIHTENSINLHKSDVSEKKKKSVQNNIIQCEKSDQINKQYYYYLLPPGC